MSRFNNSQFANFVPRFIEFGSAQRRDEDSSCSSSTTDSWTELNPNSRASSSCSSSDLSALDLECILRERIASPTKTTSSSPNNMSSENLKVFWQNSKYELVDWSSRPESHESFFLRTSNKSTPPNSPAQYDHPILFTPQVNFLFEMFDENSKEYPNFMGLVATHLVAFCIGLTFGFILCKNLNE